MNTKATEKFHFSQPKNSTASKTIESKCCKRYVADLHSNTQDYVQIIILNKSV